MKPQSIQKLFAFIFILTILSALPELVIAQALKKCTPQGKCPKGYYCASGYCAKIWPGCTRCPYFSLTEGSPANEAVYISPVNSTAISIQEMQAETVSLKIYDITGRLIKTLANKNLQHGNHQFEWTKKDDKGNRVAAGIYVLQFDTGKKSEIRKLVVIN